MRCFRLSAPVAAIIAAVPFGACGGEGDSSSAASSSSTTASAGTVPAELLGTYAMTLEPEDVPADPPPELTDQAEHWTLEISADGSVDGGPGFTIINDKLGILESSPLEVDGDHILLHDEECAVSSSPVESEYGWERNGETLRFTEVSNGCDDEVVLTLLTADPWKATQG